MAPTVHRSIETRLGERGVRYTSGRRAVVDALLRSDGPRSATELHALLGTGFPLSSLYRSLTVLEETGVLAPHHGSRGVTRYELAEWLAGHHHHLTCVECGAVEDIAIPAAHEARLHSLIGEVTRAAGFRPSGHVLEIEGRCKNCN